MPSRSVSHLLRQYGGSPLVELPPIFLAPSLQFSLSYPSFQCFKFSTTQANSLKRDLNKQRGVSAIHRTGPKHKLSVSKYPLPRPVSPKEQEQRPINPNHGLWGFFGPDRKAIPTPEEEYAHGRAWSIQELRQKSWDDLHCLYWLCVKERNRIATADYERQRLHAGFGEFESKNRDKTVRSTQRSIRHVLLERWYAWEDARELYETGAYSPAEEDVMEQEDQEHEPPALNVDESQNEKPTTSS
ncbi:mitochondrial 54S ribosomal protein YmL4 [Paracoccidioides lutzii Pb01]|uniref:Large ribosomal subunit protein uL29m n=1 Tax=Paracoccidioides lutzii (strain ATCC MYA-826 / Pb01) TaxID=502779 RepID=C1H6F2_PARBA|nr:mitochondrial 54S ribosomal protein YmL4 [Paracoccidioides lutzii Pb01]EEH35296.1 50S ribosomal protein L4 [Paracoccidioides lutzii Pb01]